MHYPNHHIRTYCLYLGSLICSGYKLDMGVYEAPGGEVSHAIVYGDEDHEYMSGEIEFNLPGVPYQINRLLWEDHLKRKGGEK